MKLSTRNYITGVTVAVLVAIVLLAARNVLAADTDPNEIPGRAFEIALEIQDKSDRVAEIDKTMKALELERLKAVASAHALDTVLCADYGLKFARVSGDTPVKDGLKKEDCPLQ